MRHPFFLFLTFRPDLLSFLVIFVARPPRPIVHAFVSFSPLNMPRNMPHLCQQAANLEALSTRVAEANSAKGTFEKLGALKARAFKYMTMREYKVMVVVAVME